MQKSDQKSIWRDSEPQKSCFFLAFDEALRVQFLSSNLNAFLDSVQISFKDLTNELFDRYRQRMHSFEITINDNILFCECEAVCYKEQTILFFLLQNQTKYFSIKKEHYLFHTILDNLDNFGIMVCDAESKILLLNDVSVDNDNYPKNMIEGRKFSDVYGSQNSTIMNVLETQTPIKDKANIYFTPQGLRIISYGSAYPIKKDDHLVGAYAILQYQKDMFEMLDKISDFQRRNCESRTRMANNTVYNLDDIIGSSKQIRGVIDKAKVVAAIKNVSILIYGETGTGKELFAQGIHNASANRNEPFVAINCASIPETLLESTLFGTVKGAFTGSGNTKGLFESAGNGTLFLDEINLMPVNMQAKLLRVIQEKVHTRVGDNQIRNVNCRIISALNRDPKKCIEDNTLRADLYYRISAITLSLPSLRERKGDIEALANHFINRYTDLYHLQPIKMTSSYLKHLLQYDWPGNVRELQHTIESSVVLLPGGEDLSENYLPQHISGITLEESIPNIPFFYSFIDDGQVVEEMDKDIDLRHYLDQKEKEIIQNALKRNSWNISKTALSLKLTRSNLQYRMKRLNITANS